MIYLDKQMNEIQFYVVHKGKYDPVWFELKPQRIFFSYISLLDIEYGGVRVNLQWSDFV